LHVKKSTVSLAEDKNTQLVETSIDNNTTKEQPTSDSQLESPIPTNSVPVENKITLANNNGSNSSSDNINNSSKNNNTTSSNNTINNSASSTSNTIKKKDQYTIIIDAGHGGPDPGSSGKKGTEEKKITLAVALKLGPILEKSGYKVIYTRKTDNIQWSGQKEELLERAAIANNANADLFVSIHTNSSEISNINGTETYYNSLSSNGKKAAQYIQNEVIKQVKLKDRGIKTEDYSVLRNVSAPSVLIELAYISTPSEENILNNSDYQNKFAQGIANGVNKYFGK
jgi:N-acetylmuramoyl-L-alanine amidase